MSELAVVKQESRLALAQPMEFSNEQVRILAETVAKGCDQNELSFFLNVCKMKRLDPFSQQIHVVKRWDADAGREKMTIQIGIDGFRVIAARTGELAGIDDPIYDSEEDAFPKWAKVTAYRYGRGNEKIPYTATARWPEYVQTKKNGEPTRNWMTKPFLMLGKCSEALALRKGFPDELSGMYTDEEMEQADNHHPGQPEQKPPVSMPKSTQQTSQQPQTTQKAAPAQQQTQAAPQGQQQAENGIEQISGTIETVKEGTKGVIWLIVDKKTLCIPADKIDPQMKVGARILVEGKKTVRPAITYWLVGQVLTLLPPLGEVEEEVIEGEIVEPSGATMADAAMASEELKGMFDENTPARGPAEEAEWHQQRAQSKPKNGEADKPGTAGDGRATRVHVLIRQNSKNTGFGEAELDIFKKMCGVLHTKDLPFEKGNPDCTYGICERMAAGDLDWHEILPD